MSLIQILVGALLALLVSGLPANSVSSNGSPAATTPRLVRIFTATIHLGEFSPPIPIPSGQRIVAKVNNGQLNGQGLNGTIQGGLSVVDIIGNGQAIVNNVRSYGTTSDGIPFLIDESGIGSQTDDFARLVLSIGGKYAHLAAQFLFTEASLSSDRKTVSTTGYLTLDR
ncbi:MAG: hypothetical protein Q9225_006046 [Loekoesia sp. 1 TL-2023]